MKKTSSLLSFILCFAFVVVSSGSACAATTERGIYTFDQSWNFHLCKDKADAEALLAKLTIADSESSGQQDISTMQFRQVSVPHDWSSELEFDPKVGGSAGYLKGGQGVYVKDFTLPKKASSASTVMIAFDGVYHRATVWLNGQKLGYHMYGYTGFSFNMKPYLKAHGDNRLVVHVDCEEQSRWYTGAGIYRHVYIRTAGKVHVKENGIFVQASADGSVSVKTDFEGGNDVKVSHSILDSQGRKVASSSTGQLTVRNPNLWSNDTPYLYKVKTQLKSKGGKLLDEVETLFGFRDIRFDADTGFWLNGKNMKLKGMCLHQDIGSVGVAVTDEMILRRLKALKTIGCNAVRCSHNPPSPDLLNICDSLGLMVIDEAFDKWKSGYYAKFFDDNAKGDIADMVLRDRNHPSIILWSIGNEVSESRNNDNTGVDRARMFNDIVKSLDTSRPTIVACQQGFADKFGNVTDVVGYNYLEPRMVADHKRHPERKMLVTEAFVYYSGLREDIVRDFVEKNPWNFVKDNQFIAGSFVWAGVDYMGESSPWPAKGWCSCPFDMTLKERPQAAFYHPAWKPEEDYLKLVVRDNCFDQPAGTDHWQYPMMADTWDLPYKDDRCVEVRCYTTCDSVQFYFPMWSNPQLPLKMRRTADYDDNCIKVLLPARQGKVLAVGYKNGKEVMRDSLIRHGNVADVLLDADYEVLSTVAQDYSAKTAKNTVSHIRLTLVDKDCLVQQMEPRKFRVEVEGNIRLLGVETGDMRREKSWRTTELNTYFGEGLIRIQSTTLPGTGRVKVFVEGFEKPFVKEIVVN